MSDPTPDAPKPARKGSKQRPVVLSEADMVVLERWIRHRYPGGASMTQIFKDFLYGAIQSLPPEADRG
ncbi:hypothetical protein [Paludisphaera soli]|uniref:hypothetical protein n=1 Tax=Paludisphaera soli TaxID=2712865 RepID=UPI0013E9A4C9|nr:hypothetical protein [Paludisphaera soli]